ncbi:Mitochondrial acidic protein MAM33 [Erysiphe necator]|uniref:Putative regulatory protein suaprga1 n=1 Tax=Uncinula necator TaxID=52586 RepID=A0A0B1P6I2_UNCNE|nr:Mitochondrial acidic protein MAM33 [Erysiphe necator]KHJ32960.1 putative regulatory protein suaprga1 [Erysiphe necator]
MISLRTFGRAAPRSLSQVSYSRFIIPRPVQAYLLPPIFKLSQPHVSFSTSVTKRSKTKGRDGDSELITKLNSELQFENEMKEELTQPTSIKDYLENSPFDIIDEPGKEEVILTRTYGQEKIQITFSISDINMDPEPDMSDRAFGAEEEESESNSEEQKNPEEGGEEDDTSLPVRLHIVVEKPGKGALAIDSVIQDSMVMIDSCLHYANPAHAHAKTSQLFHERQDLYAGPVFTNLDEELQVLFERYLDERGINTALAIFVPEYINMKEQKEYARWLKNVKEFVEA